MKPRFFLACLVAGWIVAPACIAQPHALGWNAACAFTNSYFGPTVFRIDRQGNATTVVTNWSFAVYQPAMDLRNEHFAFAGVGGLYFMDSSSGFVTSIALVKPRQGNIVGLTASLDGNYLVTKNNFVGPGTYLTSIVRVSPGGAAKTLFGQRSSIHGYDIQRDIDTGDLILLRANFGAGAELVRIDGRTFAARPFAVVPLENTRGLHQVIATGDWLTTTWSLTAIPRQPDKLFRVDGRSGQVSTVTTLPAEGVIATERASVYPPRFLFGDAWNGIVYSYDLTTMARTTIGGPYGFRPFSALWPQGGRNIVTAGGPRQWSIGVRFPGEGGQPFAIALSMSGVRPGLPLADGRRIMLNVDPLTALTLGGQLAPVFVQHRPVLDGTGRGAAWIDLRSLPGVTGIDVWISAVTLRPGTPNPIGTIADPIILLL